MAKAPKARGCGENVADIGDRSIDEHRGSHSSVTVPAVNDRVPVPSWRERQDRA